MQKPYKLRYLPLFEMDFTHIIDYISIALQNPQAARDLINNVEQAIIKRLDDPLAFEAYNGGRKRENPYYRIYVGNYVVYYVVIDDVMEVRRLLYNKRNREELL